MTQRFDITGKKAVITGGGSGIGKALAGALSAEGCDVVIIGRRADVLETAASEEEDLHGLQLVAHRINQSYPDSVTIADIMDMLNEPELRSVRKDDVEYALQAAGIMDMMESTEEQVEETVNVVEMTEWLKRRAGIA